MKPQRERQAGRRRKKRGDLQENIEDESSVPRGAPPQTNPLPRTPPPPKPVRVRVSPPEAGKGFHFDAARLHPTVRCLFGVLMGFLG